MVPTWADPAAGRGAGDARAGSGRIRTQVNKLLQLL